MSQGAARGLLRALRPGMAPIDKLLRRLGFVKLADYGLVLTAEDRIQSTRPHVLEDSLSGAPVVGWLESDLAAAELPKWGAPKQAPRSIEPPPASLVASLSSQGLPKWVDAPPVEMPAWSAAVPVAPAAPAAEPEDEIDWEQALARAREAASHAEAPAPAPAPKPAPYQRPAKTMAIVASEAGPRKVAAPTAIATNPGRPLAIAAAKSTPAPAVSTTPFARVAVAPLAAPKPVVASVIAPAVTPVAVMPAPIPTAAPLAAPRIMPEGSTPVAAPMSRNGLSPFAFVAPTQPGHRSARAASSKDSNVVVPAARPAPVITAVAPSPSPVATPSAAPSAATRPSPRPLGGIPKLTVVPSLVAAPKPAKRKTSPMTASVSPAQPTKPMRAPTAEVLRSKTQPMDSAVILDERPVTGRSRIARGTPSPDSGAELANEDKTLTTIAPAPEPDIVTATNAAKLASVKALPSIKQRMARR